VLYAFAFFFLLLGVHPFLTYPFSLFCLRLMHRRPIVPASSSKLSFAICVCAYNEERVIEDKVRNMLELRRTIPGLQILVYVDASSDRTAEILRRYEDQITLHVSCERHGKTYGMNLLVAMCKADIVVFTDANVIIEPDTLPALADYFADPDIGCVLGHLVYVNSDATPTAGVGALYWRYEEWIKQLESDTGSAMGADGSIFSIRRPLHRKTPDNIFDDMYVSMSILCDGKRIVRAPEVMAFERGATSFKEEYDRKIRIACQSFNVHRELWSRLRQLDGFNLYKYISHKFLRWNCIWTLIAGATFLDAGLFAAGHRAVAVVCPMLALVGLLAGRLMRIPGLTQLYEAAAAFWATGIGVVSSLRGVYFQTWTPADSVRDAIVNRDRPG
jgi:cellulose synthase/poly-beta-1,6-N-acetylglucosamine synthase-like glycosyltransferase